MSTDFQPPADQRLALLATILRDLLNRGCRNRTCHLYVNAPGMHTNSTCTCLYMLRATALDIAAEVEALGGRTPEKPLLGDRS